MHDKEGQETKKQEVNRASTASIQKVLGSRIDTAILCPYELIEIGPGHLERAPTLQS